MNHEESKENGDDEDPVPDVAGDSRQALSMTARERRQELRRRHHERIQDHLANVLDSPDTLPACMGAILCDLLETCQEMKSLFHAKGVRGPSPPAGFKEVMPLVDMYLKTVRQAERLANVDCRIRESQTCRPQG